MINNRCTHLTASIGLDACYCAVCKQSITYPATEYIRLMSEFEHNRCTICKSKFTWSNAFEEWQCLNCDRTAENYDYLS